MRGCRTATSCLFSSAVLLFLLACPTLAEQLPIKTYTIADGLAHNSLHSIYQDHKGFLWFGTYEGLSRFDGYGFVNYDRRDGLPHVFINHIAEDRQGRLWVATNGGGVARLLDEPRNDGAKFVSFKIRDTDDPLVKVANKVNRIVLDVSGNLWCLTDYGLYRAVVDDSQLQFETIIEKPSGDSNAALEDADGTLWFGIANDLVEIRGTEIIHHGSIDGVSNSTGITGIARDRDGRLLVADALRVSEFVQPAPSKPRAEWRRQLALTGQQIGSINELLVDDAGALWLGTETGLTKYADGKLSHYTAANGFPGDPVRTLATDRAGNLWFGTGSGACQLISEAIVSYSRGEGLPLNTVSVYEDERGRIWAVLDAVVGVGAVAEITGGNFVFHERLATPIIATPSVRYFNKIWFNGSGARIDKPRLRLRNGQAIDIAPYVSTDAYLYKDERDALWIAKADRNLYRLDLRGNGAKTVESIPTDALYGVPSTLIIGDGAGGLWLGTVEKLGRLRNGSYSPVEPSAGLPETDPRAFFLDSRGWLWIGLRYEGVSVTQEPAADNPTFLNYSREQGQLSSNAVRSITEDRDGRIYFGTDRGLDRFDPKTNQWTHFTKQDGLPGNARNKVLADRNGFIWIVSEGSISRFDPRKEKQPNKPAPIYFSRLQVAGEEVRLAEGSVASIPPREFAATQNNLTIEFVAPNYQDVSKLLYQYKLEGVDADWSAPTPERSVTFGSLAAGTYRFLARAVGENGVTSPQPAVFEFRILPPIWLRWWFLMLAALLIGLLIFALYHYRVARLLELERVRTRIATDLHDDIGSSLSQIAIMSEVVRQRVDSENQRINHPLSVIAGTSRELVDSMSDIVWAINPQRDHLIDLTQRMRQFAADVLTARNIEFRFAAPGPESDIPIETDMRREVFLIFKEAVNNAVRHANCSAVEIGFTVDDNRLRLQVADNGSGFDPAEAGGGHGLVSIKRRAGNIGGTLEILSQAGQGTTVTLETPLRRRMHRLKIST